MSRRILVDTDVMIDLLRGRPEAIAFVEVDPDRISLSSVTVAELYAGVKGQQEQAIIDRIISRYQVLPATTEIGRAAGFLKRDYGKSHGVVLTDALIAATALVEGLDLATLNVKHFPMFKNLEPPYTKA